MRRKVAIIRVDEHPTLIDAIKQGIELIGGIDDLLEKGKNVLIKPNVLLPHEDAITNLEVLKATIQIAQKSGVQVSVGDSPGQSALMSSTDVLREAGVLYIVEETGATFVPFDGTKPVEVKIEDAERFHEVLLSRAFLDADWIINLPKLKSHGQTVYTGAIKNYWGVIPGGYKAKYHLNAIDLTSFSEVLADLFSFVGKKPVLVVMDALQAMEGIRGPSHGKLVDLGLILVGKDPVAVDAVAIAIAGYDDPLKTVPHVRMCHERGLGVGDLSEIDVVANPIEEVRAPRKLSFPGSKSTWIANKLAKVFYKVMRRIPAANKSICSQCQTCYINCPAEAISLSPYPKFDRKKCILCYCCNELCPEGSIELKRAGFRGLFGRA